MLPLLLLLLLTSHVIEAREKEILVGEKTREAISLCNRKCQCLLAKKTIRCTRMKNFVALANNGEKFADEFAGFSVIVSDNKVKKIDRSHGLKKENCHGLSKIKGLTLSSFKKLASIQPLYFQKYFPNLEYLTVTESDNEMRELIIGRLPRLRVLQINGANIKKVTGCGDEHTFCFREDRMELVQLPTLNLKKLGLPEFITELKIDRNNASMEYGDTDVFKDKRINKLKFTIAKLIPFPPILYDIEVMEEFLFEIPQIHDELQLWALMVTLQEQPSLVSRMNLKLKTNEDMDMKFPVIMKSCEDCDFANAARVAELGGVCYEEQNYLDTFNVDLPIGFQKNKYLTIRGLYVDVESLLETLDGDSTFHVTIYAFVAKVPKTKFVNFDLKVYYAVLQNKVAELSQVITLRKPFTMVKYEDTFGAPIHYAKKVDALFVHAYSLCIAKLTARFIKDTPDDRFVDTVPWRMFSNLPNIAIYSTCNEVLTNSRISTIQGHLNKYVYNVLEREKPINRLTYQNKDTQEDLAEKLLESADMILKKKADFKARKTFAQIQTQDIFHIKNTLDDEDEKQIQLLHREKAKIIELANLAWRRKNIQQAQLDNIQEVLKEELSMYADIQQSLLHKAQYFVDGAHERKAETWVYIVPQLTESITSSINQTKFDYDDVVEKALTGCKTLGKLLEITTIAKELKQLMKVMESISAAYSNVKEIFQIKYRLLKRNLNEMDSDGIVDKENARKSGLLKRISKGLAHIEDVVESVAKLYQSTKPDITYSYESEVGSLATEGLSIVKKQAKINAIDIMKWDLVRKKVKTLLDEDVVTGIPQAGDYRAALLDVIVKAKTIAQLKLEQSNLENDIILGDKSYWELIEEAAALEKAVEDVVKVKQLRAQDTRIDKLKEEYKGHYLKTEKYIYYITFINKMRILDAHKEFCQGYYYHYLHRCPEEFYIDIFTPLEEVVTRYESLVLDNPLRMPQYFESPPQPFDNFGIIVKAEENCKCIQVPYDGLRGIEKSRNITDREKNKFKAASRQACFPRRSTKVSSTEVLDKLYRCSNLALETLIKHNMISIEVPVNYKDDFTYFERVRIDNIKVHINGIKTSNGKVVLTITNAGITQDRYQGDVYNFYGVPRVRKYEYCGQHIQRDEDNEEGSADLPPECQHNNHRILVSTSTHDDFKGQETKPTLFSTWIIRIPSEENKGLDLTDVDSVEIIFSGNLLNGHTDYSSYNTTGQIQALPEDKASGTTKNTNKGKEALTAYAEGVYPLEEGKYMVYDAKK